MNDFIANVSVFDLNEKMGRNRKEISTSEEGLLRYEYINFYKTLLYLKLYKLKLINSCSIPKSETDIYKIVIKRIFEKIESEINCNCRITDSPLGVTVNITKPGLIKYEKAIAFPLKETIHIGYTNINIRELELNVNTIKEKIKEVKNIFNIRTIESKIDFLSCCIKTPVDIKSCIKELIVKNMIDIKCRGTIVFKTSKILPVINFTKIEEKTLNIIINNINNINRLWKDYNSTSDEETRCQIIKQITTEVNQLLLNVSQ